MTHTQHTQHTGTHSRTRTRALMHAYTQDIEIRSRALAAEKALSITLQRLRSLERDAVHAKANARDKDTAEVCGCLCLCLCLCLRLRLCLCVRVHARVMLLPGHACATVNSHHCSTIMRTHAGAHVQVLRLRQDLHKSKATVAALSASLAFQQTRQPGTGGVGQRDAVKARVQPGDGTSGAEELTPVAFDASVLEQQLGKLQVAMDLFSPEWRHELELRRSSKRSPKRAASAKTALPGNPNRASKAHADAPAAEGAREKLLRETIEGGSWDTLTLTDLEASFGNGASDHDRDPGLSGNAGSVSAGAASDAMWYVSNSSLPGYCVWSLFCLYTVSLDTGLRGSGGSGRAGHMRSHARRFGARMRIVGVRHMPGVDVCAYV